jgi:hypothetical protein
MLHLERISDINKYLDDNWPDISSACRETNLKSTLSFDVLYADHRSNWVPKSREMDATASRDVRIDRCRHEEGYLGIKGPCSPNRCGFLSKGGLGMARANLHQVRHLVLLHHHQPTDPLPIALSLPP